MTTSPIQPEPLSVRIAKAKGCAPVEDAGAWFCDCVTWAACQFDTGEPLNFLEPAASFALLAEMVDARSSFHVGRHYHSDIHVELWPPGANTFHDSSILDENGDELFAATLPEAIAEAWLAWQAALALPAVEGAP